MTADRPTRRRLLQVAGALLLPSALPLPAVAQGLFKRVRPGEPGWPTEAQWQSLSQQVGGALLKPASPFAACAATPTAAACAQLFRHPQNPYALGDDPALTQTFGWVDAWTTRPSPYAVAARRTEDVVAAVNFAREHRLRLVVKGGGHSYQGTSNAPDSLLVWTRHLHDIHLHDAFVAQGCEAPPVRAVSVGAGAIWSQVYDAVTTQAGGYVQGGGCLTVGVAGLVQSGGFGSFSKAWGLAAAGLLEAEVVTADGQVLVANACQHPDLFWALKGGGGGAMGVVTRLTLRVHELPERFGAVNLTIHAASDAAYRRLIALAVGFYRSSLMNPHWGEQMRFRPDNVLKVSMVFQGLTRSQAQEVWEPFLQALDDAPQDFRLEFSPLKIVSVSAREFWSPSWFKRVLGFMSTDDRPGAPTGNIFWPGDQAQAGQVLHGYQSHWLPATLLQPPRQQALVDALFEASRHWGLALHFNKGLAGAGSEVLAAARDTAMNPAVIDAFALAISAAEEPSAYPGVAGHEPDAALARRRSQRIGQAMEALRRAAPGPAAYVSESNFFEPQWQQAFWGAHYARLLEVKQRYDPEGLFFAHHGVGSERWSADGFERLD